jgi:hypothetical protein
MRTIIDTNPTHHLETVYNNPGYIAYQKDKSAEIPYVCCVRAKIPPISDIKYMKLLVNNLYAILKIVYVYPVFIAYWPGLPYASSRYVAYGNG